MKIPKSLAQCADLLYSKREERLAAQKVVDALQAEEAELRNHLIEALPKSRATGISGRLATARIETKTIARVEDFEALYDYITRTRKDGGFALLQRRVSDAAVREIWDSGKKVPGVVPIAIPSVSITKR